MRMHFYRNSTLSLITPNRWGSFKSRNIRSNQNFIRKLSSRSRYRDGFLMMKLKPEGAKLNWIYNCTCCWLCGWLAASGANRKGIMTDYGAPQYRIKIRNYEDEKLWLRKFLTLREKGEGKSQRVTINFHFGDEYPFVPFPLSAIKIIQFLPKVMRLNLKYLWTFPLRLRKFPQPSSSSFCPFPRPSRLS